MINMEKRVYKGVAAVAHQASVTSSVCLEVAEAAVVAVKDLKKENLLCIQLKLLLKTYIMGKLLKLL